MQTLPEVAKEIFGKNFIGVEELNLIAAKINLLAPLNYSETVPVIPYAENELKEKAETHILFLGMPLDAHGNVLNLVGMRTFFGMEPAVNEPCFYNQDWYLQEQFVHASSLKYKWYLLRKELIDETRAKTVDETQTGNQHLPTALICAYAFFIYYHHAGTYLWKNDFIWCRDIDANGDRVYVGRYFDPKGIAKNGFSIHRHLRLSSIYGQIDMY